MLRKKPWFSIIDVTEPRGRSMADIADTVTKQRHVSLREVRGERRDKFIVSVRREIIGRFMLERNDLNSGQIGEFLNRDRATVRYHMKELQV